MWYWETFADNWTGPKVPKVLHLGAFFYTPVGPYEAQKTKAPHFANTENEFKSAHHEKGKQSAYSADQRGAAPLMSMLKKKKTLLLLHA